MRHRVLRTTGIWGLVLLAGAAVADGPVFTAPQIPEEMAVVDSLNRYLSRALSGVWQIGCRENIQREENRYEAVYTRRTTGENVRRWDLRKTVRTAATFEYRLKLKGKKISEKRLSPAADNELSYEGKDFGDILPYLSKNVVVNPMEALSRAVRGEPEYRVTGRERVGSVETRVIGFKSTANVDGKTRLMRGEMWVDPADGAVRKMTLDAESWAFYAQQEIPKEFGERRDLGHAAARRSIQWTAYFEAGEGDIGFPTRVEIVEDYDDGLGQRVTTNTWSIAYGDFHLGTETALPAVDKTHPVLIKSAAYCERLKTIALQYYCEEHINRTSYFYDVRRYIKSSGLENVGLPRKRWTLRRKSTRDVVYDYQLIKKGEQLHEGRKPLKVDGKTWTGKADPPNILPYQAQFIVYGPIGFLSASWQSGFDYFEVGRERDAAERPSVVFLSQPNEFRDDNSVYGKLWVDFETGAVRRIAWDPESIDFFRPEDVPAMFQGLEKQLIWTAYYEIEKNGIYFPSRQEIREEYIGPAGEVIVGDVWTVTYENYKFFTVDTDIEIKK